MALTILLDAVTGEVAPMEAYLQMAAQEEFLAAEGAVPLHALIRLEGALAAQGAVLRLGCGFTDEWIDSKKSSWC